MLKQIIKSRKFIFAVIVAILTAFLLYPHSTVARFLWFAGSYLSPGTESSFTGWFVFIWIFFMSILNGFSVWFIYDKVRKIITKWKQNL